MISNQFVVGGLKVWECTYDILKQLNEKNLSFNNKYCLDLGCGSGVLGIYCLLQGAICTFQDYVSGLQKFRDCVTFFCFRILKLLNTSQYRM